MAINVEPDILLVDEVLSVGDESFQRKCIDRIRRMQRDGRTILVVSHATDTVRQICDRAVVLDHGHKIADGPPGEAIRTFREALAARGVEVPLDAEEADHTPPVAIDPATGEIPIIVSSEALQADPDATVTIRHVIPEYPDRKAGHLLPGQPLALRDRLLGQRPRSTTSRSRWRSSTSAAPACWAPPPTSSSSTSTR